MSFIPSHTALPIVARPSRSSLRRVLVVEDRQLIRDCIGQALEEEGNLVVRTAGSDRRTLAAALSGEPYDAVVLGAELVGIRPLELIRWVRRQGEETGILVHGLPKEEEDLALRYVEAGARAFVLGESTLEEMKISLQGLLRGETVCDPALVNSVFSRLARLARERGRREVEDVVLSLRELEVLRLVATGLRNKEICQKLFISLHTVKNHMHRILAKLEVRSRHEAVHRARRAGWL